MKKILANILVLFFINIFITFAFVDITFAERLKVKIITGEVVSIDTTSYTIIVKGKITDLMISANDFTLIKEYRTKKAFTDIAVGDKVIVKYFVKDNINIAKSIEIKKSIGSNTSEKK